VRPVETDLGRKTQIDQASCNTDYSCLDGDCPSFVTVRAPSAREAAPRPVPELPGDLPEPARKAGIADIGGYGIVATGIGGTGVVMLNQVLATAAFLDGLQVTGLDQTGLSQKAGPVVSHLRLWRAASDSTQAPGPAAGQPRNAQAGHPEAASAVGEESADLLLALDLLVATEPRHLARMRADRTATVASTSIVATAGMVRGTSGAPAVAPLLDAVRERSRAGAFTTVDTVALATALFGDSISANLIALGAAYQAGALPVAASSIGRAIELNGVAVERNQAAFRAGRLAVHDPGRLPAARRAGELRRAASPAQLAAARRLADERGIAGPVAELAIRRAAELTAYQSAKLAGRYLDLVGVTAHAEAEQTGGTGGLTEAVVDAFFHLLAYKDEYEVARLHLLPEFDEALAAAVGGGRGVRYRLHPPVLRSLGMRKKVAIPAPLARGTFRVLRSMRHVRGTPADVFGYTRVRRAERRLVAEYDAEIRAAATGLSTATHSATVELARLPLSIRGYEGIKLAAVERYESDRERIRALLASPSRDA
jgi:indolepyruvate ferredoxin oxidoreductase